MRVAGILLVALLALCSFSTAGQMDACTFDRYVLGLFNENEVADSARRHLELLDFVVEYGPQVETKICADKNRLDKLVEVTYTLYQEQRGAHEMLDVYTKYAYFRGREEKGRIATDEDNAAYNLLLDFTIAKYNFLFASSKREMLMDIPHSSWVLVKLVSDKLFNESRLATIAKSVGKTTTGVAYDIAESWAGLWFDNESPLGRNEKFDVDYSWIMKVRDNFLEKYPESRYKVAIQNLIDEETVSLLENYDREDDKFSMGIGLNFGKTLLGSPFADIDETVALGFAGRFQYHHLLFQLQMDGILGHNSSAAGLDGIFGYSFEIGSFAVDALAGIGFVEFVVDKDSSMNLAYIGGIQVMKRLPVGDALYISPKFQWLAKMVDYENSVTGRNRWGLLHHFFLGFVYEGRIPLSKMNTDPKGDGHRSVRK